jgi:CBS domain-containing protein
MAQTVREIMSTPVTCPADTTVMDAAGRMRDDDIGDVVVESDGALRGIVTDRDIVVRVVAEGEDPKACILLDICSGDLVTVTPETSIDDAARQMREHAIRRLIVAEGDQPVGVVSIGDLAIERDESSALADISAAPGND